MAKRVADALVTTPESVVPEVVDGMEPPRDKLGRPQTNRPRGKGSRGRYTRRDPKANDPTSDGSILTTVAKPVESSAGGTEDALEPGKVGREQEDRGEMSKRDPRSNPLWAFIRW